MSSAVVVIGAFRVNKNYSDKRPSRSSCTSCVLYLVFSKEILRFHDLVLEMSQFLSPLINSYSFQYMVKCGKKQTPEEGCKAEVSENYLRKKLKLFKKYIF